MAKKSEERKALIEATALSLFASRGFAEVSVRDIAQACDIGESALYRHMSSKEELAARVFREAYLGLASKMIDRAILANSLHERLWAYLEIMLGAYDEDPDLLRFLLIHQHDVLAQAISDEDITPVTLVVKAIHDGMQAGEIPEADPNMASALVMGAALQPLTFHKYGRLTGPAIAMQGTILRAVMAILHSLKGDTK